MEIALLWIVGLAVAFVSEYAENETFRNKVKNFTKKED